MTDSIRAELEYGMPPLISHLSGNLVNDLVDAYGKWLRGNLLLKESLYELPEREVLARFLVSQIGQLDEQLNEMRRQYAEYAWRYRHATIDAERQDLMIEFSAQLGFTPTQLAADRNAFDLYFGHDAVMERFMRRESSLERDIAFVLGRLGIIAARVLKPLDELFALDVWHSLGLLGAARTQLAHQGDARVRIEAFRCLTTALRALGPENQAKAADEELVHFVYRAALERAEETWIQTEALSLLQTLSASSMKPVMLDRINKPGDDADIFVRRHIVGLLANEIERQPELMSVVSQLLLDPSPHVRQGFSEHFTTLNPEVAAMVIPAVCGDESDCVRAAGLVALPTVIDRPDMYSIAVACLHERLTQDTDSFVLRAAFKTCVDAHQTLIDQGNHKAAEHWYSVVEGPLTVLNNSAEKTSVRRWASLTRERLWVQNDAGRRALLESYQGIVENITPGKAKRYPTRKLPVADEATTGRVLSVLTQEDHGIDVTPGRFRTRIARGYIQKFRFWRAWFEFRNPATDKRQAFRHTIGRVFHGTLRAPSAILSELARTKVPGEPLHMGSEDGWRGYLPLVDELISALDHGPKPLRLYTSEGTTELHPPYFFLHRLIARTRLQFKFAHLADLRNWQEGSQSEPKAYLEEVRKLGFCIKFQPHGATKKQQWPADPTVVRFFPAFIPAMPALPNLPPLPSWGQARDYFFSAYENNLSQLAVFLTVVFTFFFGRHVWLNYQFKKSRQKIGFVFGGWGTRGKSGTERIKAALISALGYSIVSKTTGCEAMFLYSYPFGKVREMFLFRPYDKATIWEQTQIINLTAKLDGEVFLWECMGLTPSYVDVLQRQWMKDDLSTITNTYPDHEDVQGPAGVNIAEVMTNFIPPGGNLITTEEQMYPILRDAAIERGTPIRGVGWLEAGLLAPDVLERFPYEEHPYNIGLVLACAEELGVTRDFAVKEMADQVVPDLGVLKTYPGAKIRGRVLEFINGCSANERFGCSNNWTRMGYDTQDVYADPSVWISTVVNNRADRIPRSRVFADMLADTLYTDRHYLIGTNLDGLQSYIRESWEEFIGKVTLWPVVEGTEIEQGVAVLESWARKMRIPIVEDDVRNRLAAMAKGVGLDNADTIAEGWRDVAAVTSALAEKGEDIQSGILEQLAVDTKNLVEYLAFEKEVTGSPSANPSIDEKFRAVMTDWYMRRFVVLENSQLDGEQVVDRICTASPPGIFNRLMGLQNIKGTGLDFVYRWLAWEECSLALKQLRSRDPIAARQGLSELVGFKEFGLLSEEEVRETIEQVRSSDIAQDDVFQSELTVVSTNLEKRLGEIHAKLGGGDDADSGGGRLTAIADALEAFLDAGDAIKRRKRANRIYRELAAERISLQLGAFELQKITKRQKGGWLAKQLNEWIADTFQKRKRAPATDAEA